MKVANETGGYRYVVTSIEILQKSHTNSQHDGHVLQSHFHNAAIQLRISGNMAVIITRSGYAGGIAYDIDSMHSELILGTIAGADTVIVALDESADREDVLDTIANILPPDVVDDARKHLRK